MSRSCVFYSMTVLISCGCSPAQEERKPDYAMEKLREQIRAAFNGLSKPDRTNIARGGDEAEKLIHELADKHWDNLTVEYCESRPDALGFLTPEAFRFYLPAFLLASLRETNGKISGDCFTLYHLEPPSRSKTEAYDWFSRRFELFSRNQLDVLIEYLESMRSSEGYQFDIDYVRAIAMLREKRSTKE